MDKHHHHAGGGHGSGGSLAAALAITVTFLVIEFIGGLYSGSLALLADSGHMLADALALGMSLTAEKLAARVRTRSKTYGYKRAEILAAFINGLVLWAVVVLICRNAYFRLQSGPEIKTGIMLAVAIAGLVANIVSMSILYRSAGSGINARSALLHVATDALGSIGAIAAAVIIALTGFRQVDPIVSVFICLLILWSSTRLIMDSVHILMEGTPAHIDTVEIEAAMLGITGVCGVHDLHVWTLTSGFDALSSHLTVSPGAPAKEILNAARLLLAERFGLDHVTIQIEETGGNVCCSNDCAPGK